MICIASDHAGYELKEALKLYFAQKGYEFDDLGTHKAESCHYPEFGEKAARAVASGKYTAGILVCGTGAGISMAAGKVPGIRCACCSDASTARLMREHNDANMLAMGARIVGAELAFDIADAFLNTPFSGGGRHQARIDMIMALDKE